MSPPLQSTARCGQFTRWPQNAAGTSLPLVVSLYGRLRQADPFVAVMPRHQPADVAPDADIRFLVLVFLSVIVIMLNVATVLFAADGCNELSPCVASIEILGQFFLGRNESR